MSLLKKSEMLDALFQPIAPKFKSKSISDKQNRVKTTKNTAGTDRPVETARSLPGLQQA